MALRDPRLHVHVLTSPGLRLLSAKGCTFYAQSERPRGSPAHPAGPASPRLAPALEQAGGGEGATVASQSPSGSGWSGQPAVRGRAGAGPPAQIGGLCGQTWEARPAGGRRTDRRNGAYTHTPPSKCRPKPRRTDSWLRDRHFPVGPRKRCCDLLHLSATRGPTGWTSIFELWRWPGARARGGLRCTVSRTLTNLTLPFFVPSKPPAVRGPSPGHSRLG